MSFLITKLSYSQRCLLVRIVRTLYGKRGPSTDVRKVASIVRKSGPKWDRHRQSTFSLFNLSCSLKIEIKLSFEQFTELSFASRTSTPAAFCCRLRTNPLLKLLFVAGCVPLQTVPWCVALFLCKGSFSTPDEKRSRADCTALRRADFLVVKSRHPQLSMMRSQNAFCGCTTQLRTSIRYTVLGLRCFEQTKKVIENIFLREILHSLKIIGCM